MWDSKFSWLSGIRQLDKNFVFKTERSRLAHRLRLKLFRHHFSNVSSTKAELNIVGLIISLSKAWVSRFGLETDRILILHVSNFVLLTVEIPLLETPSTFNMHSSRWSSTENQTKDHFEEKQSLVIGYVSLFLGCHNRQRIFKAIIPTSVWLINTHYSLKHLDTSSPVHGAILGSFQRHNLARISMPLGISLEILGTHVISSFFSVIHACGTLCESLASCSCCHALITPSWILILWNTNFCLSYFSITVKRCHD